MQVGRIEKMVREDITYPDVYESEENLTPADHALVGIWKGVRLLPTRNPGMEDMTFVSWQLKE